MRVIYVDDEKLQLENFKICTKGLPMIEELECFQSSQAAFEYAMDHKIDVAFLDIEMPVMNGIELAKRLKEMDGSIRIIFVTAYEEYALEAFGVRAIGYLLKPYTREDIQKELENAGKTHQEPLKKEIHIETMPDLSLTVNGKAVVLGHTKQEELFALLVDRGKSGVTKADALECLWDDMKSDSTYWTCLFRLKNILEKEGLQDLIVTNGNTKYLNTNLVTCDLYQMLDGDSGVISRYTGQYLRRFSWAEYRLQQLHLIWKSKKIQKKYNNNYEMH